MEGSPSRAAALGESPCGTGWRILRAPRSPAAGSPLRPRPSSVSVWCSAYFLLPGISGSLFAFAGTGGIDDNAARCQETLGWIQLADLHDASVPERLDD